MRTLIFALSFLLAHSAVAAPAAKPPKKLTKAQLKAEEEKRKKEAEEQKRLADEQAKKDEAARLAAEEDKKRQEAEAAAAAAAAAAAQAASQAAAEAAAKQAAEEQVRKDAEAQAASQRAAEEAASQQAADEAARIAKENEKEIVDVRAQVGVEMFAAQYMLLGNIDAARKKGAGVSFGGAVLFRPANRLRLGVEFQRTQLPSASGWNKFLLSFDFPIAVIPILEITPRIALGYVLANDGSRMLHGGAAKAGLYIDVRPLRWFAVGAGADADLLLFRLGEVAAAGWGLTFQGRVSFLF